MDENPEDLLEVLKLFLDNGQDVNAVGLDGSSILHYCAENAWVKEVAYLMSCDLKPDLTIKDKNGGIKVSHFLAESVRKERR